MSAQETWEDAKAHRDGLAVKVARALVNGRVGDANVWASEFRSADADMARIKQESGEAK